jgi:CheY-like chemotaxis protein
MTSPRKILVVDDDPTTLEMIGALLEAQGHSVVLRDTALGTTQVIIRDCPDVVLLDVRMPGLSGDKLAELISSRRGREIVVLYSGSPQRELGELARRCGAAGFITKTSNPSEFLERFESILAACPR